MIDTKRAMLHNSWNDKHKESYATAGMIDTKIAMLHNSWNDKHKESYATGMSYAA